MSLASEAMYEATGEATVIRCSSRSPEGYWCEQHAGHAYAHSAGQGWAEWN